MAVERITAEPPLMRGGNVVENIASRIAATVRHHDSEFVQREGRGLTEPAPERKKEQKDAPAIWGAPHNGPKEMWGSPYSQLIAPCFELGDGGKRLKVFVS